MDRLSNKSSNTFEEKLEAFRKVPDRSTEAAEKGRAMFLAQASQIAGEAQKIRIVSPVEAVSVQEEKRLNGWMQPILTFFQRKDRSQVMTFAVSVIAVLAMILGGSGITVAAAQNSLPGEPLYGLKLWSEDTGLKITYQTQSQMELSLDFANRRVDEIKEVLEDGEIPPAEVISRYEAQVEYALQLTAGLESEELQGKLLQIRQQLLNQEQTILQLQLRDGSPEDAVRDMAGETIRARIGIVEEGLVDEAQYKFRLNQPPVVEEEVLDEVPVDNGVGPEKQNPDNPDSNGPGPNSDTPPGEYGPGPEEPDVPGQNRFGPSEDVEPGTKDGLQYGATLEPATVKSSYQNNYYYSYGENNDTSQNQNMRGSKH